MDVITFGKRLIETGDLDPVYILLSPTNSRISEHYSFGGDVAIAALEISSYFVADVLKKLV
jgi:hypothetical protein